MTATTGSINNNNTTTANATKHSSSRSGKKNAASKKNNSKSLSTTGKNGRHQQNWHASYTKTWIEDREGIVRFWLSLGDESRKQMLVIQKDDLLQRMKDQSRQTLCHCEACARRGNFIDDELEQIYDHFYRDLMFSFRPLTSPRPPSMPKVEQSAPSVQASPAVADKKRPNATVPSKPTPAKQTTPQPDQSESIMRLGWDELEDHFDFTLAPCGEGRVTFADELIARGGDFTKLMLMLEHLPLQENVDFNDSNDDEDGDNNDEDGNHDSDTYIESEEDEEDDFHDGYDHRRGGGGDDDLILSGSSDAGGDDADDGTTTSTTAEERMEESRRMFQIFAAKIVEERVVQAYLEKVAADNQEKFLLELAEEEERERQAELKKKQKKANQKEKKRQEKQQREAERAAKREQERLAAAEEQLKKEKQELEERLRQQQQLEQELREKMEAELELQQRQQQQLENESNDASNSNTVASSAKKKSKAKKKKKASPSSSTPPSTLEDVDQTLTPPPHPLISNNNSNELNHTIGVQPPPGIQAPLAGKNAMMTSFANNQDNLAHQTAAAYQNPGKLILQSIQRQQPSPPPPPQSVTPPNHLLEQQQQPMITSRFSSVGGPPGIIPTVSSSVIAPIGTVGSGLNHYQSPIGNNSDKSASGLVPPRQSTFDPFSSRSLFSFAAATASAATASNPPPIIMSAFSTSSTPTATNSPLFNNIIQPQQQQYHS